MVRAMKNFIVALPLLFAASAAAQEASLLDLSRELRAETGPAAQAGDWEAARRTNAAALALQPGHSGLLGNAVVIAQYAGDREGAFLGLEAIAAHGLSLDVSRIPQIDALREADPARLEAIEAALAANAAPVGEARQVAATSLKDSLIEALAVDSETERLYLGSVADRRIFVVEPHAPDEHSVFAGQDAPIGSIFGLAVDRQNGRLYAAEGVVGGVTPLAEGEAASTALLALDLETGEILDRYTIEGAERIGDVFVRDGAVFATDADAGRIYRLDAPDAELALVAEDSRFASPQGIVSTRGAIYVADYALGVWRIDPVSGASALMASPPDGSLIGLDGMTVDRTGRLFVIRNGATPRGLYELHFETDARFSSMTPVLVGDDRLGEPVTVRITDGRAFLINDAQWPLFEGEGADADARTDPLILSVPLP